MKISDKSDLLGSFSDPKPYFTLKKRFLCFAVNKKYKMRRYSFWDKINFINKYGETEFIRRLSDVDGKDFEIINFEIAYSLISDTDKKDFGSFDDFLKCIDTVDKEGEILIAVFRARGFATSPKITDEEIKEETAKTEKKTAQ